jgi:hypothetical protein
VPISLVIAFRQQFPEGSLLSEVLTIHDGLFVVRVSVAVEGQVLSQALGSNNSLELAEDIACNRALERLALTIQATASLPGNGFSQSAETSQDAPSRSEHAQAGAEPAPQEPPSTPNGVEAEPRTQATHGSSLAAVEVTAPVDVALPEPVENSEASTPHANTGSSQEIPPPVLKLATPPGMKTSDDEATTRSTEEATTSLAGYEPHDFSNFSADPIDLSDIIAQTDVELQRLRWDVHQGREFLEKTYGKRSRHDLTDEELLEFLLYLESQSTPSA